MFPVELGSSEVRRSVCVVRTFPCLVELDLISGPRSDPLYHIHILKQGARLEHTRLRVRLAILRCSAVVAPASGGRHGDLLASSHGDGRTGAQKHCTVLVNYGVQPVIRIRWHDVLTHLAAGYALICAQTARYKQA
jgi:hypothetical protein